MLWKVPRKKKSNSFKKTCSNNAYLVHRYIRVLAVHGPECETTLLQLRLGVVPLLVDDEVLQTGEETYFGKQATIFLKKSKQSYTATIWIPNTYFHETNNIFLSPFLWNCFLCRDCRHGDVPLWLGAALLSCLRSGTAWGLYSQPDDWTEGPNLTVRPNNKVVWYLLGITNVLSLFVLHVM